MLRLTIPCLLLSLGFLGFALAQEPPTLPAQLPEQKAFERKAAKAKADYELAMKKARAELKADLEEAKVAATKVGDLEKAIAIRDRLTKDEAERPEVGEVKQSEPLPTGLVGPVELRYANNTVRQYIFGKRARSRS